MFSTVPILAPARPKESSKSRRTYFVKVRLFSSTRKASRVIMLIVNKVLATEKLLNQNFWSDCPFPIRSWRFWPKKGRRRENDLLTTHGVRRAPGREATRASCSRRNRNLQSPSGHFARLKSHCGTAGH